MNNNNKFLNSLSILGIVTAIAVPCLVLDTGNYINKTEIIFVYAFYIIGTWLVFAVFIIFPVDLFFKKYTKKENAKLAFELEINSFTNINLPKLAENLIKLQILKEELENKKKELSVILNNLNKEIAQDKDIRNWEKLLVEIDHSISNLLKRRDEAYLTFKKSDMPNSDYRQIISNIESESSSETDNITQKYYNFRAQIEKELK